MKEFIWGTGIAQSVERFATGWTVRGLIPGGDKIFRTRPDRPWDSPSHLYNKYRVSFPVVKRSGRGADHPHLAARLKKEQRYTSTPPLDLRGLFWVYLRSPAEIVTKATGT